MRKKVRELDEEREILRKATTQSDETSQHSTTRGNSMAAVATDSVSDLDFRLRDEPFRHALPAPQHAGA
ncbi:hypothetical protein ACFYT7_05955 [Streptomyces sp. NPDC004041]|uniref:hypothetical protein n=1 Tax=Streptomyces sp. NPDC004041 TaxID=3364688 RepID=UPI003683BC38